jgi:hypothetical protein
MADENTNLNQGEEENTDTNIEQEQQETNQSQNTEGEQNKNESARHALRNATLRWFRDGCRPSGNAPDRPASYPRSAALPTHAH